MESNNHEIKDNFAKEQPCVVAEISKKTEQDIVSTLNEESFIDVNKETELYLKLHIANHKPG